MSNHFQQRTLANPIELQGVGVHSGKTVNLTIKPAVVNYGIKFKRIDLPDTPPIPALFKRVIDTSLATVIGSEGVIVSTIEHLMAGFAGLAIDNALVELDAYEMPILDGSAAVYTTLLKQAGIVEQEAPRTYFVVTQPIEINEGDKSVGVYPAPCFQITCSIVFSHPIIGSQTYSVRIHEDVFDREISQARTFGFLSDLDLLKQFGLARGASLETGIAIDNEKILNPEGLRYADEFVRHKILDCIGDFSLIGMPILGHIKAHKSGHAFNHAFLEKFFKEKDSWETRPLTREEFEK